MVCRQDQRRPPLKYSNKTTQTAPPQLYNMTATGRAIVPPNGTIFFFSCCEENSYFPVRKTNIYITFI